MATIIGTAGNDTIFPGNVSAGVTGGEPSDDPDSILGGAGADSLGGGGGNDTIRGEGGNDVIFGWFGDDQLFGGDGDDVLNGGFGDDLIDGGAGFDIIEYGDILSPTAPTFVVTSSGGSNNVAVSGSVHGNDTVLAVEQINGSPGDDTFIIDSVNTDTFLFYVRGGAGNDSIAGPSTLNRGLFLDYLAPFMSGGVSVNLGLGVASDGFGGTDSFTNINAVRGSAFDDTLIGGDTNDRFRGRGGNDWIDGGAGSDLADYTQAAGAVSVDLSIGRAQDGDGGIDTLISIEEVRGSNFNDTIIGSDGADRIRGNAGNDSLVGGGGIDTIEYVPATGPVSVNLGTGLAADGQGGTDTISGFEYVLGGGFNDNLIGGAGNDTLNGAAGNDFLTGGPGDDWLIGGAGFDTANYSTASSGIVAVVEFNGTTGHNATVTGGAGNDTLREIEAINGSGFGDVIEIRSVDIPVAFQARGGAGNDTIIGMADRNYSVQADYLLGGMSSGIVADLESGIVSEDGFGGQDLLVNIGMIRGSAFGDTILGSEGNDRIRGRGGNDYLDGRGGTDQLDYTQSPAGVSVNLALQRALDGEGGLDTVIGFEDVRTTAFDDTIIGTGDNEVFLPFGGNDYVDAGAGGSDRVVYTGGQGNVPGPTQGVIVNLVTGIAQDGWGGTDTLLGVERINGTPFADSIVGGAENNRFNGRGGNDTLDGGLGGDWAEYNNAATGVTVNLTTGIASDGEGGTDLLISIENVIGSSHADHLTGVAQGGRSTSDLRGGAGNDTLVGIVGEFVRADYADQTQGLSINLGTGTVDDGRGGTDTLIDIRGVLLFGDFADTVIGTANDEWISPGNGADFVNAGEGFDIISYGATDSGGVSVNLATNRARDAGGATDTILGFEGVATSYGDDSIFGNALGNLIAPNAGADFVNGGAGEDTISYSLGFTPGGIQYTINEAGDRLPVLGVSIDLGAARATDFSGATDTILSIEHAIGSTADDLIRGSALDNYLAGAEGNDTIEGRGGNDTLDGGAGGDRMLGGLGDDVYIVEDAGDVVIEYANQGTDVVLTTLAAYTLTINVENLFAIGAGARNFGGNGLDNRIVGGAGSDTLSGAGGNDTLDGGLGGDRMLGGLGNDVFIVDDAGDLVIEYANQGIDTVLTSLSAYTLTINVENLMAMGSGARNFVGNGLDNLIVGGDLADTLIGGAGNDTLDGGAGNDVLYGGAGNDTFLVTVGDIVFEGLNLGTDTVVLMAGTAYALGANLENLVLAAAEAIEGNGNALDNVITGNDQANILRGFAGRDVLDGGAGNDVLVGGANGDTLTGGAGNDVFRYFAASDSTLADMDVIMDFSFSAETGVDRIDLRPVDANTLVAGDQAFRWIADAGFSGLGAASAGELRFEVLSADHYQIMGDTDGDGTADIAIAVLSGFVPEAGWFIL